MNIVEHTTLLEEKVLAICIGIDIENHYYHVRSTNPANYLPYHNWYHALCMVLNCYNAANYYNLPLASMRAVCVAALWHDYNHSGGKHNDTVNVANAIKHFRNYHLGMWSAATRDLDGDLSHVPSIIAVTEYPYVCEPYGIEQRIIRDADLMQVLQPTWYEMCITGLGKEMSVKLGKEVTEKEMVDGQLNFLKNITLYTQWGNETLSSAVLTNRFTYLIDKSKQLSES